MRRRVARAAWAAALFLLLAQLAAAAPITVRVYHTNDIHGWIMARPDRADPARQVGGAPALAALLAREPGPRLLLDAGDWWQGTPEGSVSRGASVAEVFNALGYDAVVVGNHEYDAGQEALKALVPTVRAAVLSANTRDAATGRRVDWLRPWTIKEVAGVKFGIFGLTTSGMAGVVFSRHIEGLSFRREVDEAREAVAELRQAGAEVIVALTHVGFEEPGGAPFEGDQTIAREVPGIDLIVGGHSHTFLHQEHRDPKHGTLVVHAGQNLLAVGRTTLVIDEATHRVLSAEDELVDLDPAQGEDPAVKALVAARAAEADRVFSTVVASAPAALARNFEGESALGGWMTDCYREHTGAEIGLQVGGGIRADLPAGPVTLRHLFNVMPFDNALVKLRLKGREVRAALDHGLALGRMAQVSGLRAEVRRQAPAGQRLGAVTVAGEPLDDARDYSFVTLDYAVNGGDGFDMFARAVQREPTGTLARDALRACAEKQKILAAPPAGRVVLRED